MDAIFDFFNQGWVGAVIGLLGVILAVVSIWLAYHFYRRSRQGAQLAYHHRMWRVLGAKGYRLPEAVKITFRDQPIENLCRSRFLVWNSSDKTIYGRNIVESDPLRIVLGEKAMVLDSRIVKFTRSVNNCQLDLQLTPDDVMWPQPTIKFDYLDSGDGCVIELFHTDSGEAPTLRGSIHEMPRPFRDYKQDFPLARPNKVKLALSLLLGVVLVAFGLSVFIISDPEKRTSSGVITLIGGLVFLALAGRLLVRRRRRYPEALSMPEFFT